MKLALIVVASGQSIEQLISLSDGFKESLTLSCNLCRGFLLNFKVFKKKKRLNKVLTSSHVIKIFLIIENLTDHSK